MTFIICSMTSLRTPPIIALLLFCGLGPASSAEPSRLKDVYHKSFAIGAAIPSPGIPQGEIDDHDDRRADGQSSSWSLWTWNPIQGGGVASWARVNVMERRDDGTLFGETVPKLWDMPNEEAAALMRQWTGFKPSMPDVVVVKSELICQREHGDRWGKLGPKSTDSYRYRLVVGDETLIASRLDSLISKYAGERASLIDPKP